MAKLLSGSRVYGSLTVDNAVIAGAGAGFQSMNVYTTGTSAIYVFPTALQVANAKFKVTMVGGGGGGGGTFTTAGFVGGGGGSGALISVILPVVSGQYSLLYTVGAAGTGSANLPGVNGGDTSIVYNGLTYTAGGGTGGPTANTPSVGGAGGVVSGAVTTIANNVLIIPGGQGGSSGTMAATTNINGRGGDTPLGFGYGGPMPATAAGATGLAGTGYGSGGSGARNGTGTATQRPGGAGTGGIVIIEF